jgi:hypothetical protein
MMLTYLGIALIGIGVLGMVIKTAEFVRGTIPDNFGSNPGFGVYETMSVPWWAAVSIGVGIMASWRVALVGFAVGLLALGLFAQILGRVFGR